MDKIYRTDEEFREAIEKEIGIKLLDDRWETLKLVYEWGAIHLGYTEADVNDGVWVYEQLKKLNEES